MENGHCCWLCGRNGNADPLDKHHIFGGPFRKKSEKYGAYVFLCHHDCHIFGENAAHNNKETMQKLHEYGQLKVMREQGWTVEQFIIEFGKNYIDWDAMQNDVLSEENQESGFQALDGEVGLFETLSA